MGVCPWETFDHNRPQHRQTIQKTVWNNELRAKMLRITLWIPYPPRMNWDGALWSVSISWSKYQGGEQFLLLRLLPSSFDRIVTGRSNNSNAAQNQEPHFNWPALIMGTSWATQAIQAKFFLMNLMPRQRSLLYVLLWKSQLKLVAKTLFFLLKLL